MVDRMKTLKRSYGTKSAVTGSLVMSVKKTLANQFEDGTEATDVAREVTTRLQGLLITFHLILDAVKKSQQILFNATHIIEILTRVIVGLLDSTQVYYNFLIEGNRIDK